MKLKSTGNSENIQRDIVHFHCAFNYRRLADRLKTVLLTTRVLSPEANIIFTFNYPISCVLHIICRNMNAIIIFTRLLTDVLVHSCSHHLWLLAEAIIYTVLLFVFGISDCFRIFLNISVEIKISDKNRTFRRLHVVIY